MRSTIWKPMTIALRVIDLQGFRIDTHQFIEPVRVITGKRLPEQIDSAINYRTFAREHEFSCFNEKY